jgi:hypothetical protein
MSSPSAASLPTIAPLPAPPDRELLRARLFLRAALPVVKVVVEDDPAMNKRFNGVHAVVQFQVKGGDEDTAAFVVFDDDVVRVDQGYYGRTPAGDVAGSEQAFRATQDRPDITFTFSSVRKLNDFFAGKTVLPKIKGLTKPGLVAKVLQLLLSLKLMLPSAQPKEPEKRRLKVKLTLYMITTALSQFNKGGDPEMMRWTGKQPERVYQMLVGPEGIGGYLGVRGGLSKAGRGVYERRRPFVMMRFHGVDGALAVMNKEVGFVDGVSKGLVRIEGSPEYAANFNDFMMRVQALLMG